MKINNILFILSLTVLSFAEAQRLPSIELDKEIGIQMEKEILSDTINYPILDNVKFPEAYALIKKIQDKILASGAVKHKNDFVWKYYIIDDPNTVNAFATPGGYMYIYTGLMKYLDNEAQLAAVIGHEIAHADNRHSIKQMKRDGFVAILQRIRFRRRRINIPILKKLRELGYSRGQESESDTKSIEYLCGTSYDPNEFSGFFEKSSKEDGKQETPEFLSTHPSDKNRVEQIHKEVKRLGCTGTDTNAAAYLKLVNALPEAKE